MSGHPIRAGDPAGTRPPRVSVLVPVRNAAATLGDTLASVLRQTWTDFELIVVDDASCDGTLEMVQALHRETADPRLRWLRLETHSGPSAARNAAFARSRGRYVAPLDGDDLWLPEKLERQIEALSERPRAVLAYSWTSYVDGAGRPLGPGGRVRFEGDVLQALAVGNFLESGSNPLIRRQAWAETGGFDETLRAAEDWDFYLRLARVGPFAVVPAVHVLYRKHDRSASTDVLAMERCARRVLDGILPALPAATRRSLRRASLGNLYKYLFCQVFKGVPSARQGRHALRFLARVLWLDPAVAGHPRTVGLALLRALLHLVRPRRVDATPILLAGCERAFLSFIRMPKSLADGGAPPASKAPALDPLGGTTR